MTTDEQIHAPLAIAKEHTKRLEMDGQHTKQLAMIVHEQNEEVQKVTNGIQALVETVAQHQSLDPTRLTR